MKIDRSIWTRDMGVMAMGKKGDAQDGLSCPTIRCDRRGTRFTRRSTPRCGTTTVDRDQLHVALAGAGGGVRTMPSATGC
jgi:hypothetical protein